MKKQSVARREELLMLSKKENKIEAESQRYRQLLYENLEPCFEIIRNFGFEFSMMSDLYKYEPKEITILVPILLEHFKDTWYVSYARQMIGRVLEHATRDALAPYFYEFVSMYETEPKASDPRGGGVRWVIGCILDKSAKGKDAFEKIEELLFDKSYEDDRMSMLTCIRRMPKEQKERVRKRVQEDPLLRENINRR